MGLVEETPGDFGQGGGEAGEINVLEEGDGG